MTDLPEYVLERTFDAPPALVWRTWTEPDLVTRWYGPGVTSIVHAMEVKPGGVWLHEMQWGGNSMYQKADYVEVDPPNRLVMIQWSSTDAEGNPIPNQMQPDWPEKLLTTVTFVENAGKTDMRLTWVPHEATAAEIAFFEGAMEGLGQGWGAGMEALSALLSELK